MLDWLGCAAIGAAQPESAALLKGSSLFAGLQHNLQTDPWSPLMFAASVGNLMEMDDIHRQAVVHPGPVVVPAALFLARARNASLHCVLTAIVQGYEAMIRLGQATGRQHYAFWHTTATCGPTGAACAAASLMALKPSAWLHAIGHAATQSAGLWQVRLEPCLSKQWHTASAARTGISAALLAQADAPAPAHILEGDKGFFNAMCPGAQPELLTKDPDAGWAITETSFKPWPACRHTHPAIGAALNLRELPLVAGLRENNVSSSPYPHDWIKLIEVETYQDAINFCDAPEPETSNQGRFSLQHTVAVSLLQGSPTLEDFEHNALTNLETRLLRRKIRVRSTDHWTHRYPARFGAAIILHTQTGEIIRIESGDAPGDPELPMTTEQIRQKSEYLMRTACWPDNLINQVTDFCLNAAPDTPVIDLCTVLMDQAMKTHLQN